MLKRKSLIGIILFGLMANSALNPAQLSASLQSVQPVNLNPLIEQLKSDDWQKRSEAAQALGALGPQASKADADLLRLLRDPNPVVRYDATNALRAIHPNHQVLVCFDLPSCAIDGVIYGVGWAYRKVAQLVQPR